MTLQFLFAVLIKSGVIFISWASVFHPANAQNFGAMTAAEREAYFSSIREASAADHKSMMRLLNIDSLRAGVNGRDPKASNAANYDESKATPFPKLPEVLLSDDGTRVTTASAWWDKRRNEIAEHFDREIYGRVPANLPEVKWQIVNTAREVNGSYPVITKKLLGHVRDAAFPEVEVAIELELTIPEKSKDAVPLIMQFGFVFPPGFTPAAVEGPTWQQQLLGKGWGYAVLYPTSIQADNGAGLSKGIIGLMNRGMPRDGDDWGTLRAWAWGASRALDYFETDPSIDAKKIGITGHSRFGKAAVVTMAYDQRFAIGYISSSGAGGLKLHRRNYGEAVENVAAPNEYHWMAGNYLRYAGPLTWDDLPVDAHQLLALCAPRPVFVGSGEQGDAWVDPKGMFLACFHASPVYELLGKKGVGAREFPPAGTALTSGDIAFRQHSGGHTPGPNWPSFLEFANRYFDPR